MVEVVVVAMGDKISDMEIQIGSAFEIVVENQKIIEEFVSSKCATQINMPLY